MRVKAALCAPVADSSGTDHLMKVHLYQVAFEKCDDVYSFLKGGRKLKDGIRRDSMMCIGNKEMAKESCQVTYPLQSHLNDVDK
jgi:hypothetical protein